MLFTLENSTDLILILISQARHYSIIYRMHVLSEVKTMPLDKEQDEEKIKKKVNTKNPLIGHCNLDFF